MFGAIDNEESKNRTGFAKNPIFFAVIFVSISLVAIGCGVYMLCKKDNPDAADSTGPGYSVAISNRLFKVFHEVNLNERSGNQKICPAQIKNCLLFAGRSGG